MAAPTRADSAQTADWGFGASNATKTITVNIQTGDIIVVRAGTEDGSRTLTISNDGAALTWNQRQVDASGSHAWGSIWTTTADSNRTLVISLTRAGVATSAFFGGIGTVWRNSGGIGVSNKAVGTGTPSVTLTGVSANAAIDAANFDWNAVAGGGTWGVLPGAVTEEVDQPLANYGAYTAYYADTGAAGNKTVTMSAPTGQAFSIFAIEILPNATGPSSAAGVSGRGTVGAQGTAGRRNAASIRANGATAASGVAAFPGSGEATLSAAGRTVTTGRKNGVSQSTEAGGPPPVLIIQYAGIAIHGRGGPTISGDSGVATAIGARGAISTTNRKSASGGFTTTGRGATTVQGRANKRSGVTTSAATAAALVGRKGGVWQATASAPARTITAAGTKGTRNAVITSTGSATSAQGSKLGRGGLTVTSGTSIVFSGAVPGGGPLAISGFGVLALRGSKQGRAAVTGSGAATLATSERKGSSASFRSAASGNAVIAGVRPPRFGSSLTVGTTGTFETTALKSTSASAGVPGGGRVVIAVLGSLSANGSLALHATGGIATRALPASAQHTLTMLDLYTVLDEVLAPSGAVAVTIEARHIKVVPQDAQLLSSSGV